jgi:alkylation response protein AidB-like acyl-CoA dehydrogenase
MSQTSSGSKTPDSPAAARSFADAPVADFRAELRSWLAHAAPPFAGRASVGEVEDIELRRAWEHEVVQAGYNCLSWPTQFGGRGLGPIEEFVFAEECVAVGVPEGLGRIGRLLAAPAFFAHGTPEQQSRFLPRILHQDDIWCQGFSEPNAGSDLANVQTSARRSGDVYLVNGQKIWTSFGHYSDWCLLITRTSAEASRHRGLTMFAMPMHQPGVQPRRIKQISGDSEFNEVFYDDAEVGVDCRIGAEGDGWRVAMTILTAERGVGYAALALNDLRVMLDILDHCADHDPVAQGEVSRLRDRATVTRWQVMCAIERMAADRDATPSSSIMKLIWSELTQDVVRTGFELGCPEHRDRWRYLELDARSDTIASGSSEIQRNIISERVLGLPR